MKVCIQCLSVNNTALSAAEVSNKLIGGAKRDRTADLLLARQALSQLSYGPKMVLN